MPTLLPVLFCALLAACNRTGAVATSDANDGDVITVADATDDALELTADVTPEVTGPPRRVLFIGNSYTYYHDLPAVVRALGEATPGAAVTVEMIAVGGAALYNHWLAPATLARIASGDFDVVVLQGQSTEAMLEYEGFDYYAQLLAAAIDDADAEAVWFATWARRAGSPEYPGLGSPAYMTWAIEERYRLAAAHFDDLVALVGSAFQLAGTQLPDVGLYDGDGSHPSPAGTLLASCVILHALTGVAPRVPTPAPLGLSDDTAAALCALAPRVGPAPKACPAVQALCDGECVYLDFDARHCGECGNACAAGDPCRSRVCGCDAPYKGCDGGCYDLATSDYHCGVCGVSCKLGEHCRDGTCQCATAVVVEMTVDALAASRPACVVDGSGSPPLAGPACREAAHELCAAAGACIDSGLPPPTGHSPPFYSALCVAGTVVTTDYATLGTFVPECDGVTDRSGKSCVTAVSRYCASTGAVSGFGPVASDGDSVTVTCLTDATMLRTTPEILQGFASRCVPDPVECQSASRAFCESLGHTGGFGPVEVSGNDLDVVCVGP